MTAVLPIGDGTPTSYGAIYADPSWQFRVWNRDTGLGRSAEAHYRTMPLDEIKALPVASLAAKDCCLFLWSVCSMLPEALAVGAAWNFQFKTVAFDWAKLTKHGKWHMGMGYWSRQNTELCLLFTCGKPKRLSRSVRQLVVSPVREHSRKPDEVYERIEQLVAGPYIELFARQARVGWDNWGLESPMGAWDLTRGQSYE